MQNKLTISLLDDFNNIIEKISYIKPNNFDELVIIINKNFKNLPKNYNIYYKSESNKDTIINNNDEYKASNNILFIKEIKDLSLSKSTDSLFSSNYKKLSESQQEELDEKYNCIICELSIKKESPLLCYQCQKIFHKKCLDDWNNKCKNLNVNFNCPKCKYELPLNDWKEKINYEEERKNEANILEKLNDVDKIKDNKDNEIYDEYNNLKLNETKFFKEFIGKIDKIKNLLDNNVINNESNLNYDNQNEITNFILESLEDIEKQIKSKLDKNNKNKIINNFYLNKNYIKSQENIENSIENNFSIFNNFNDISIQQENEIKNEIKIEFKLNGNKKSINQNKEIKSEISKEFFNNKNKLQKDEINKIKEEFIYSNKSQINQNKESKKELIINNNNTLINQYNDINNEIECIYVQNYREENEINLMHDYQLNKDEIPINSSFTVELYLKNKIIIPNILREKTDLYIDNINTKFDFKYKIKGAKQLKVKFKFKVILKDISFMFCNCRSLVSIDFTNFIPNELTNISGLFCNCISLKKINFSKFNTNIIYDMSYLFYNCNSIESVDFKSFNMANIKNMSGMFSCCSSIKYINLSSFNTNNLEYIDNIFNDCKSLIYLDISSFDTTKIKNISGIFNSCCSLKKKNIKFKKGDKKIIEELQNLNI